MLPGLIDQIDQIPTDGLSFTLIVFPTNTTVSEFPRKLRNQELHTSIITAGSELDHEKPNPPNPDRRTLFHTHRRTIRDVCRITHHNDEAYVAALAVLRAMQLPSNSRDALAMVAGDLPDTNVRDVLMTLAKLPDDATAKQAAAITGTSGYAPESVPLAVFIATTANSLESGIFSAVECGGDTDTIASMVGHILGARGHNVPVEWLSRLPCTEAIEALPAP